MKEKKFNQLIKCDVKSCKHLDQENNQCALNSVSITSNLLKDSKTYCGDYEK